MNILVLNRFFETNPENAEGARARITGFVNRMLEIPEITELHVAVNPADQSGALAHLQERLFENNRFRAYTVNPWGKFVPALNAALEYGRGGNFKALLCISTEMVVTLEQIQALAAELTDETLVVGARLEGHDFREGEQVLTGTTTPWNTFALWNMQLLRNAGGFSGIGEAYSDPTGKLAGVEEMGHIAQQQMLHPHLRAVLKEVAGVEWNTGELDEARAEMHRRKMESKIARPQAQMERAGLTPGRVIHIVAT